VRPDDRPCRFRERWARWDTSGAAVCGLDDRVQIVAQPDRGCAFWTREPGADDDVDDVGVHHSRV